MLLSATTVQAQSNKELFDKANELYRINKYTEAIKIYEQIENNGAISSELYFNLGNAYYKINSVAPSIYNYEKALQLNPLNLDATTNLAFAKRMTLDHIEALPKTLFQKLEANYIQQLSFNQWAYAAVVCSFLTAVFFLLFYFSFSPSKKRIYFITSILSGIGLFIVLIFAFKGYRNNLSKIEAIIFEEKTSVKNAPTKYSEEIFELHEGTKVLVLDTVESWKKIKIDDGKTGWISKDELKEL